MTRSQRVRRFVPTVDALSARIAPSGVDVCPMSPTLIDFRLPQNTPTVVNPMSPTNTDLYAFLTTNSEA